MCSLLPLPGEGTLLEPQSGIQSFATGNGRAALQKAIIPPDYRSLLREN
jgi:hypothetical protein